jgi:hypothetical protein
MVVLMLADMTAMHPGSPRFWGIMSLATLVGGVVAYPINVWLVHAGYKHGMGTDRPPTGAPGRGVSTTSAKGSAPSQDVLVPEEKHGAHDGH